ncbi:MAG: alpha/beta hydrolase [Betaproteobacteria bacterium]|nr:alpha/beta hydrolase [Betaproteobacteria bacterium]
MRRHFVIALVAPLMAGGCTLAKLESQTREYDASTVLVGRVETGAHADGPIVVGAYTRGGPQLRLAHQTRLHEHGGYELIVPRGEHVLFAFADRNGNGLFDEGEPAARHAGGRPVAAAGSGMIGGLDMVLGDGTTEVPRLEPAPRHSTQAGAPIDLDADRFSAARGRDGYWEPLDFFRSQGGNIHFVEPYDPSRTPVLFVHGAAGSPQDWRHQIAHLDRSRYQAWLYFYPSGAPVESMSHLLYWKLLNLQLRYRFERLQIVAHSMGGLVARRLLLDNGEQLPQVRRFVTLSTPWAGEVTAESGVRLSPAVVPSWHDMRPDGPFMRSLFDRRLPAHVDYSLLFGHRGAPGLWRPNNDGTVTLASQLRRAAQEEARTIFGYDEDHVSILVSPQVTAQLQGLLARDEATGAGGRLDVRLDYGTEPRVGIPLLVLRPLDPPGKSIAVAISAAEGGASVSALAPGPYEAGVLADGFLAQPPRQSVSIGTGGPSALSFRLRPQGSLNGYVGEDRARPAGALLAAHAAPRILGIRLHGPGVDRTLSPRRDMTLDDAYRELLDGRDLAWASAFTFQGLPEGEYELAIEAAGRPVHRSRHLVVPGRSGQVVPIVLAPER